MDKQEVIDRLDNALAEIHEIDLRGRRKGTAIYEKVTIVRDALIEAIVELDDSE